MVLKYKDYKAYEIYADPCIYRIGKTSKRGRREKDRTPIKTIKVGECRCKSCMRMKSKKIEQNRKNDKKIDI